MNLKWTQNNKRLILFTFRWRNSKPWRCWRRRWHRPHRETKARSPFLSTCYDSLRKWLDDCSHSQSSSSLFFLSPSSQSIWVQQNRKQGENRERERERDVVVNGRINEIKHELFTQTVSEGKSKRKQHRTSHEEGRRPSFLLCVIPNFFDTLLFCYRLMRAWNGTKLHFDRLIFFADVDNFSFQVILLLL